MENKKCVFDAGTECGALCEKKCNKCSFMKTGEELWNGRRKAEDRLRKLGLYNKMYKKYHDYYAEQKKIQKLLNKD